MGKEYDYDVTVIGGGPGGYSAAIRASQLGARAAVVERGELGGVCTNVGCIPTKVLVHAAKFLTHVEKASELGVEVPEHSFDFAKLAARRDEVVGTLRKGIGSLLKGNKVELIRGEASFKDDHVLKIASEDGEIEISSEKIFVATGSVAADLPIMKADGETVMTSAHAIRLTELPESIIVVGGGYIGCEFAGVLSKFGVDVKVVEVLDHVLPWMDPECGQEVARRLKKGGVDIYTSTKVEDCSVGDGGVKVGLSEGDDLEAEKGLLCVGRKPQTEGLNLEAAGLEAAENGALEVNEHMQTSVPHIYAIGDVTGKHLLAHVALHEATTAAAHATGTLTASMDYRVVPACVFTFPEIATVGISEEEARESYEDVIVKKFPMRALGRAHIEGETDGFVKMIAHPETRELLGVHIAAVDGSSLIAEAALALELEATADELAETIHAHPTMPEAVSQAAEGVIGLPIDWMG